MCGCGARHQLEKSILLPHCLLCAGHKAAGAKALPELPGWWNVKLGVSLIVLCAQNEAAAAELQPKEEQLERIQATVNAQVKPKA